MTKKPTIIDIAKILGVSTATVHRALHNHPSMTPMTKNRVLQMAKKMGELLKNAGYEFSIEETHHVTKLDSPSGTAITLANTVKAAAGLPDVPIRAHRVGDAAGLHVLEAKSTADRLVLTHEAYSRRGFAEGAVRAAEWISTHTGCYDFQDICTKV